MEKGYKFHLLSITFWTLICDLNISFLLDPYPLLPMSGGCLIGRLPKMLEGMIRPDSVLKLGFIMFYFLGLANIGALFNATLHKYLFVSNLVGHEGYRFSKSNIYCFMFVTQIIWPLAGAGFASNTDLHPSKTVEESKKLYPDIFAWTAGRPCAWAVKEAKNFVENFLNVDFFGFTHILFCISTTLVLLCLCWKQILNAQNNTNVSKKTLKLQRSLLISLTIQCILPCLFFLLAFAAFIIGFVFKFSYAEWLAQNFYALLSLHSVLNSLIVGTCPIYYKGLFSDFKMLLSCGRGQTSETPVSSISFVNPRRTTTAKTPTFRRAN